MPEITKIAVDYAISPDITEEHLGEVFNIDGADESASVEETTHNFNTFATVEFEGTHNLPWRISEFGKKIDAFLATCEEL